MRTVRVRHPEAPRPKPRPKTLEERFESDLMLHYQPVVDAKTGTLAAFEALLRSVGEEEPSQFPGPTVEAYGPGSMHALDRWVVQHALQDAAKLRDAGIAVPVHINIAVAEINDDDDVSPAFEEWLRGLGDQHGQAVLEILETSHITNTKHAHSLIDVTHQLGMEVAFDDFGVGQATFLSLQALHPDIVKLDRQFTKSVLHDPRTRAIVHTLIKLSHDLHMKIIAEGVEGTAQWEWLRLAGCDEIQGFIVSQPLQAPDEVVRWHARWSTIIEEAKKRNVTADEFLLHV